MERGRFVRRAVQRSGGGMRRLRRADALHDGDLARSDPWRRR